MDSLQCSKQEMFPGVTILHTAQLVHSYTNCSTGDLIFPTRTSVVGLQAPLSCLVVVCALVDKHSRIIFMPELALIIAGVQYACSHVA